MVGDMKPVVYEIRISVAASFDVHNFFSDK